MKPPFKKRWWHSLARFLCEWHWLECLFAVVMGFIVAALLYREWRQCDPAGAAPPRAIRHVARPAEPDKESPMQHR